MPSETGASTSEAPATTSDHQLSPEDLRRSFEPQVQGFEDTGQITPVDGIIGQERVLAALQVGLGIQDAGFNIFVSGLPGIGKMTAVRLFLEESAQSKETPPDWVYVNNFDDPYQPRALKLPAGLGRQLALDMKSLVDQVRRDIQRAYESDQYLQKRNEIIAGVSQQRETALEQLIQQAADAGFVLRPTSFGFVILPMREGRPLEEVEFATLPAAEKADLRRRRERLEEELADVIHQLRQPQREANYKLEELNRQVAMFIVGEDLDQLREKYRSLPEVVQYLTAVHEDILEDIKAFKSPVLPGYQESLASLPWLREVPSRKYEVNLLVDNSQRAGAPVVVELNPTYNNLFGRIEKESHLGTLYTDFTMVRPGAIHRANGGYLVLPVEEVLQNPFSWDSLKRALGSNQIEVEELAERLGFTSGKTLRPQPVPLGLKAVLVGRPLIYHLLRAFDLDFPELFKVKADFDIHMEATDENVQSFVGLIATLCQRYELKPLDREAVARVLEHSSRMAEDKKKLSTHFGALADILKEAHFWAAQKNAERIGLTHVQKALDQKVHRSDLLKEHIHEMVRTGALLVQQF